MSSASPDLRRSFQDEQPPSPSTVSRPIDIPNNTNNFATTWDSLSYTPSYTPAYTPSYHGSFGSNQDSTWGDHENPPPLSQHHSTGDFYDDKYEPEVYHHDDGYPQEDAFSNASPYLVNTENNSGFSSMAQNSLFGNDSQAPVQQLGFDQENPYYSPRNDVYGGGSPGSSIGLAELNGPRSRASSVNSINAHSSPFMATANNEYTNQPLFNRFSELTFDSALDTSASPSWNQSTLPTLVQTSEYPVSSPPGQEISPSSDPRSPPGLMIPSESPTLAIPGQGEPQPAINLVPATPISPGGVAGGGAQGPFQQMLANLNRQHRRPNNTFNRVNSPIPEALPSQASFTDTNMGTTDSRSQADAMTWSTIVSASGQSQGTAPQPTSNTLPQSRVYHHGYNLPVLPNDYASSSNPHLAMPTSLPHSQSEPTPSNLTMQSYNHSPLPSINALYTDPNLLGTQAFLTRTRSKSDTSSRTPSWIDPDEGSPSLTIDANDGYSTPFTFGAQAQKSYLFDATDLEVSLGVGDASLRRTLSDGSRVHKKGVKSEDLTLLRGPTLIQTSNADFIRSVTAADGSLAPIDPRTAAGGTAGPLRRRGSGAGHERGSSLSSVRSSPYQKLSPHNSPGHSPHQSPLPDYQTLPTSNPTDPQYIHVERPLVTTPATKTASANRRRAEATFVCPVPNCGSTFTRHFNLRGHLRSHNEERPFKCKWPGCEKGFARQHDCKRHEALHLNIRPYTCDGCQKTFARMDALNRHLRSEGGIDCQKVHQLSDSGSGGEDGPQMNSVPKIEVDALPWATSGALVM